VNNGNTLDASGRLFLSVSLVAERLSIGKTFAWELVSSGEIASVRIGKRRLVSVAELERYARQLAVQSACKGLAKQRTTKGAAEKTKRVRPRSRESGEVADGSPTSGEAGKTAGTERHGKQQQQRRVGP
jgi:excisionase family DNA binding protein